MLNLIFAMCAWESARWEILALGGEVRAFKVHEAAASNLASMPWGSIAAID